MSKGKVIPMHPERRTFLGIKTMRFALGLCFLGLFNFAFAYDDTPNLLTKALNARRLKDYSTAFRYFKIAAEEGNAEAEYDLAYCYLSSQGVDENDFEAVKWLQKSADQGFAQAEYSLGNCYENGTGLDQNQAKAMEYYQKAAQQGFQGVKAGFKASVPAGSPDTTANPVPAAPGAAPAGGGEAEAWVSQGKAALEQKNYPEAVSLFQKAAEAGNADGELLFGSCYIAGVGTPQNPNLAAQWFRKAAEGGNAEGQAMFGALCQKGLGVKKDPQEAVNWFQKAADQGEPIAETALGVCYLNGEGVTKNREKAKELLKKAADQGNKDAKKILARLGG
jgi:hypothetical protein